MGTIFVDNIKQQSSQGSGTITIGASGETGALASGVKQSNLLTPAFEAYKSGQQSGISNGTSTKVQINAEKFDTDSCYDKDTNYRFTPNVAGKYFVYAILTTYGGAADAIIWNQVAIYKNGSVYRSERRNFKNSGSSGHADLLNAYAIIDMNGSSDYLEIYVKFDINGGGNTGMILDANETQSTIFGGYRIGA